MNLYHYICPSSNYPPKMLKGIIYGLIRTYKLQNTKEEDYLEVACLLHKRHVARGWGRQQLKSLTLDADLKLCKHPPSLPPAVGPAPPDKTNQQTESSCTLSTDATTSREKLCAQSLISRARKCVQR